MKIPYSFYGVTRQVIVRVDGCSQQKEQGKGNSLQPTAVFKAGLSTALSMLHLYWSWLKLHPQPLPLQQLRAV